MSRPDFLALARAARPQSEADFGSDRHLTADVAFWEAVQGALTVDQFDVVGELCFKGTCSECVDHGLAGLRRAGVL